METDWIVCDASRGGVLICERCGGEFMPQLPMAMSLYVEVLQDFGRLHRHCKPATEKAANG